METTEVCSSFGKMRMRMLFNIPELLERISIVSSEEIVITVFLC